MLTNVPIGAFYETVGNSSVEIRQFLRHQVSKVHANLSRMAAIESHLPNNWHRFIWPENGKRSLYTFSDDSAPSRALEDPKTAFGRTEQMFTFT